MNNASALMVQGTASSVGKSLITTALCRIFTEDGFSVAPFKAQNMALNSTVTYLGEEIGIAQALQAKACNILPDSRMNPVLLKPISSLGSQVIVRGTVYGTMSCTEYYAFKQELFSSVREAYTSLSQEFDIVVIEGAGSPAEINLRTHDIVNMSVAHYADASVLLVADIDKGGAFASLVGTMQLLNTADSKRIAGFILNKFRGDIRLLDTALTYTSHKTQRPFLGTIPYYEHALPEEDSVQWKNYSCKKTQGKIIIGIIDTPSASNITDFTPLLHNPEVSIQKIDTAEDIYGVHGIIIGGSKYSYKDLCYLNEHGFITALKEYKQSSPVHIFGICGGMQILGKTLTDEESTQEHIYEGIGLLDIHTHFERTKRTLLQDFIFKDKENVYMLKGYEIHCGNTTCIAERAQPCFFTAEEDIVGYTTTDNSIWGTYIHGIFENNDFCTFYLDMLCKRHNIPPLQHTYTYNLEKEIQDFARHVRSHLNMEYIYALLNKTCPKY